MALLAGPLLALALHFAAASRYGFFRDELYFVVCGQRLAWGFVDQPPLFPALAALSFHAAHGSILLFRLPAALIHAAVALGAAMFARRLGGRAFAQALAGLCVATSPLLLGLGHLMTVNALEPLFWLACAAALERISEDREEQAARWWLAAGALAGVGMLNKHSMAFFVACLLAGLLVGAPRLLLTRWLAAAALLALLVIAPHLLWQWRNGFPMLELLRNGRLHKNAAFEPAQFLLEQFTDLGPLHALVWLPGAVWLVRKRRSIGLACVFLIALLFLLQAKAYYAAAVYPILFAGGAVAIEQAWRARARLLVPALVTLEGFALAPLAIPILPEAAFIQYQARLGMAPRHLEKKEYGALPQVYADQHGWDELARTVAGVVHALPPAEQQSATIYAQNYGEAAAIELLGGPLPRVISGHNNYFLWGPGPADGPFVIVGGKPESHREVFADVREVARLPHDPLVMPYEDTLPIWLCRGPRLPIAQIWPRTRHYE
jgi:hypothetical protein